MNGGGPEVLAVYAVAWIALHTGHHLGDYWVQTHHQAGAKAGPGWTGRLACARHVVTLTATQAALLGLTVIVVPVRFSVVQVLAALTVNALSHYWADRRTTLLALAQRLERVAGKGSFARVGVPRPGRDDLASLGTGAVALDQAWHTAWLMIAALLIAA